MSQVPPGGSGSGKTPGFFNFKGVSTRFKGAFRDTDDEQEHQEGNEGELGVEYDDEKVQELNVPRYENEPFYFTADDSNGYKNNYNLALQMNHNARPTLSGLVDSCRDARKDEGVLFEQGMWVEYRSNDMQWKVGLVNRVVKQAPDSWDYEADGEPPANVYNVYYNVGLEGVLMDEDHVRAPKRGLTFIFGRRPWLWQQHCLLQFERRIRFDENHEADFDEIDCQEFASDRFNLWLEAEGNKDFKALYDSEPTICKKLLKDHMMTPFVLCDKLVEDTDLYDWDDEDISIYTYMSVFGSGLITVLFTVIIQLTSPLVLVYNAMFLADGAVNERFVFDVNLPGFDPEDPVTPGGTFLPDIDIDQFCSDEVKNKRAEGKIMIAIVLFVYVATVIPDSLLSFYRTSGGASSTFSKINSLRQIIWNQNDDTILQQVGFKFDRLMNTGYVTALYALMIFILIQTPIILDIILNALAFEFIHEIDERIANSDWYDEGNRWIKAGAIELVIQSTLRLRVLENPKKLCKRFQINYEEYCKLIKGSLRDAKKANEDDNDYQFMSHVERKYRAVAVEALQRSNDFAFEEYSKGLVQFGLIDQFLQVLGLKSTGVFNRYNEYRTWSKWETILFLPKLPNRKDNERVNKKLAVRVAVGSSDRTEFVQHIISVMTGHEVTSSMFLAFAHRYYLQVPLKFFLGLVEWISYFIQLIFPLLVIPALVLVPICY